MLMANRRSHRAGKRQLPELAQRRPHLQKIRIRATLNHLLYLPSVAGRTDAHAQNAASLTSVAVTRTEKLRDTGCAPVPEHTRDQPWRKVRALISTRATC
jgi:hypothetical protein